MEPGTSEALEDGTLLGMALWKNLVSQRKKPLQRRLTWQEVLKRHFNFKLIKCNNIQEQYVEDYTTPVPPDVQMQSACKAHDCPAPISVRTLHQANMLIERAATSSAFSRNNKYVK